MLQQRSSDDESSSRVAVALMVPSRGSSWSWSWTHSSSPERGAATSDDTAARALPLGAPLMPLLLPFLRAEEKWGENAKEVDEDEDEDEDEE